MIFVDPVRVPATTGPERLHRFAEETLGEPTRSRLVRQTKAGRVLELVAADGRRWFVKRYRFETDFLAEVTAYRHWTPALGDRAPTLVAAEADRRVVIVTAVPGERPANMHGGLFVSAGRLLRAFHKSVPPTEASAGEVADRVIGQLERQLPWCRRLDVPVDEPWVRRRVAAIAELEPLPLVPCHGDFLPHNWLVDDAGTVRVIDFAGSRLHAAAYDVVRLLFGLGWRMPTRVDGLLHGYGRRLTAAEIAFVDVQLTVTAVTALSWAARNRRPRVRSRADEVLAAQRDGFRFRPSVLRGHAVALHHRPRPWSGAGTG